MSAAVPPLAAAAALTVGLGVLKRVVASGKFAVENMPETGSTLPPDSLNGHALRRSRRSPATSPGAVPAISRIRQGDNGASQR